MLVAEASMKMTGDTYEKLRVELEELPLVDCHEHHIARAKTIDIMRLVGAQYHGHDFASAVGTEAFERIMNADLSLEDRWPDFERAWLATRHTGYGRGTRYGLAYVFGSDEVTLANLKAWQKRIPDYSDPETFEKPIADAKIRARVTDNWPPLPGIMDGSYKPLPRQRLAISLPQFHNLTRRGDLAKTEEAVGSRVTSLDEYLQACRLIFERWREAGAVCFKDQSAYTRRIAYSLATRSQAEELFNEILANPRGAIEWSERGNALSDYLMHAFMRIAREMDLPVQLHTGHMAGTYNDVAKANAANLRSLLEVHRDVRFDLFHANWPYAGDLLFLAKNYPNVSIDFCWAHQVDPVYSQRMLVQSVASVPFTKIHGFGSDVGGDLPHITWAYAKLARDGVASALAELVDGGYLGLDDARELALAWLYENPRAFFRLDLPPAGGGRRA
jgi:uncharacterized protein